jgi:AcrR family transcriptional regulator
MGRVRDREVTRIKKSATELFAKFGYNGATLRDIASACSAQGEVLPKSNIHYYYKMKHALYQECVEDAYKRLMASGDDRVCDLQIVLHDLITAESSILDHRKVDAMGIMQRWVNKMENE